jgi:hypothetical protein
MKDYNALAEQLIKIFKKELVFSSTEIRNSVKDKHSINAFKKKISEYYSKI